MAKFLLWVAAIVTLLAGVFGFVSQWLISIGYDEYRMLFYSILDVVVLGAWLANLPAAKYLKDRPNQTIDRIFPSVVGGLIGAIGIAVFWQIFG